MSTSAAGGSGAHGDRHDVRMKWDEPRLSSASSQSLWHKWRRAPTGQHPRRPMIREPARPFDYNRAASSSVGVLSEGHGRSAPSTPGKAVGRSVSRTCTAPRPAGRVRRRCPVYICSRVLWPEYGQIWLATVSGRPAPDGRQGWIDTGGQASFDMGLGSSAALATSLVGAAKGD